MFDIRVAIQLILACKITTGTLRVTPEYSFALLGRMDRYVNFWIVVNGSENGIPKHGSIPHKI